MHHNEQLRVSHLILSYMPSYTNYQDSSGTLTHRLTSSKARHQRPRRVRQGSLEPVHDGLAHMIFQGRVMHILVEAPIVEAFVVESTIPINPTVGMVQRCTMALDCWFPAA